MDLFAYLWHYAPDAPYNWFKGLLPDSFYDYQKYILLLLPCDWLRDQTQGSLAALNALNSFVLLL